MFLHHQLATTLSADRQHRMLNSASRRRLVRRNRAPAFEESSAGFLTVVWPDEVDHAQNPQRAHCAA
jgi:hypothetical protein